MSDRTDLKGISSLGLAFPKYKVYYIDIRKSNDKIKNHEQKNIVMPLHLKSVCSSAGPGRIIVGGDAGKYIQAEIKRQSLHSYDFTYTHDTDAANVVFVNDVIIRRCSEEFPRSAEALHALGGEQRHIDMSELKKVDGALTCSTVLF